MRHYKNCFKKNAIFWSILFLTAFLTHSFYCVKRFDVVSQNGVLCKFEGDSMKEKSIFTNMLVVVLSILRHHPDIVIDQTKGKHFLHPSCWILLWWMLQSRLSFCIDLSKAEHVKFSSQMALLRGSLSDPLSLRLCLNLGSVKSRLIKSYSTLCILTENVFQNQLSYY